MVYKSCLVTHKSGVNCTSTPVVHSKVVKCVIKSKAFSDIVDLMLYEFSWVNNDQIIFVDVFSCKSSKPCNVRVSDSDVFSLLLLDLIVFTAVSFTLHRLSVETSVAQAWNALFSSFKALAFFTTAVIFSFTGASKLSYLTTWRALALWKTESSFSTAAFFTIVIKRLLTNKIMVTTTDRIAVNVMNEPWLVFSFLIRRDQINSGLVFRSRAFVC